MRINYGIATDEEENRGTLFGCLLTVSHTRRLHMVQFSIFDYYWSIKIVYPCVHAVLQMGPRDKL